MRFCVFHADGAPAVCPIHSDSENSLGWAYRWGVIAFAQVVFVWQAIALIYQDL